MYPGRPGRKQFMCTYHAELPDWVAYLQLTTMTMIWIQVNANGWSPFNKACENPPRSFTSLINFEGPLISSSAVCFRSTLKLGLKTKPDSFSSSFSMWGRATNRTPPGGWKGALLGQWSAGSWVTQRVEHVHLGVGEVHAWGQMVIGN